MAQEDRLAALRGAVAAVSEAYLAGDVERLAELIPEDYVHTNQGSEPISREAWFDWVRLRAERHRSGTWSTDAYDVSELRYVLNGDSAVVTGRVRSTGARDGAPWAMDIRFTMLWVWRDGRWKRAAFQDAATERSL